MLARVYALYHAYGHLGRGNILAYGVYGARADVTAGFSGEQILNLLKAHIILDIPFCRTAKTA